MGQIETQDHGMYEVPGTVLREYREMRKALQEIADSLFSAPRCVQIAERALPPRVSITYTSERREEPYQVTWVSDFRPREAIVQAKSGRQAIGRAIPEWDNDVLSVTVTRLVPDPARATPERVTHGRDCECTPCQAEDWDAIEAQARRS